MSGWLLIASEKRTCASNLLGYFHSSCRYMLLFLYFLLSKELLIDPPRISGFSDVLVRLDSFKETLLLTTHLDWIPVDLIGSFISLWCVIQQASTSAVGPSSCAKAIGKTATSTR